jgi:hypothetical protein
MGTNRWGVGRAGSCPGCLHHNLRPLSNHNRCHRGPSWSSRCCRQLLGRHTSRLSMLPTPQRLLPCAPQGPLPHTPRRSSDMLKMSPAAAPRMQTCVRVAHRCPCRAGSLLIVHRKMSLSLFVPRTMPAPASRSQPPLLVASKPPTPSPLVSASAFAGMATALHDPCGAAITNGRRLQVG